MISLLLSRVEAGGLERVQFNLWEELQRRGMAVEMVAGRTMIERQGPPAVQYIAPRGTWQFMWRVLVWMRQTQPEILVTTSSDVAVWMLLWRRWLSTSTAVVVTQHQAVSGPLNSAVGLRRIKLRFLRQAMRRLLPAADAIVAVSAAVAADMCKELGLPPVKIRVIHNPVVQTESADAFNTGHRRPSNWPYPLDDVPTLIFVGRLSVEKRLDLLLDAFLQVRAARDVRLIVLGDGPMRETFAQWIQQYDIGAVCRMLGHVEDVLPWIQHSNVLALTSDYEGFGNVLVEAMLCGTQIVATDCPSGPSEVLQAGVYGQLVPVGDALAVAAAVLRILNGSFLVDPQTLRRRASEFTVKRATDDYVEVFNEAISCRHSTWRR